MSKKYFSKELGKYVIYNEPIFVNKDITYKKNTIGGRESGFSMYKKLVGNENLRIRFTENLRKKFPKDNLYSLILSEIYNNKVIDVATLKKYDPSINEKLIENLFYNNTDDKFVSKFDEMMQREAADKEAADKEEADGETACEAAADKGETKEKRNECQKDDPKDGSKGCSREKTDEITDYKDPKKIRISLVDAVKFYFATNQQLKNLQFSDVSLYSSTFAMQSKYTAELLLDFYDDDTLKGKKLTDATACIGCNSVEFSKIVGHVNSVEITQVNSQILKNNVDVLGLGDKITVYNDNFLNIKDELSQDIYFIDPPWSGVDYYKKKVSLYLEKDGKKHYLLEILKELIGNCEMIILKLPKTLDDEDDKNMSNFATENFGYYYKINILYDKEVITPNGEKKYVLAYKLRIISKLKLKKKFKNVKFPYFSYKRIKIISTC